MNSLWRVTMGAVVSFSLIGLPLASASISGATTTPTCIISLSPSATESLFALGVGKEVKAVDATANFPQSQLPKRRIDAFSPNLESILNVCPGEHELVVISYDANQIQEKLQAQGVQVLNQPAPANLAAAYTQIRALGIAVRHLQRANSLIARMKHIINAAIQRVPRRANGQRVYYELDPTYYSLTSASFVGSILKKLHVVNIADAKGVNASGGYPQLSVEYVVSANPTIIFLADTICCSASSTSVSKRVGFKSVVAVKRNQVFALNDDVASRWGPRLVLLVQQLARDIKHSLRGQS